MTTLVKFFKAKISMSLPVRSVQFEQISVFFGFFNKGCFINLGALYLSLTFAEGKDNVLILGYQVTLREHSLFFL